MPKTRRTADQWQALIQQHDQSPLSTAEFCRKKGLTLSSFYHWRGKLRQKIQPNNFIEVTPPADTDRDHSWSLEVDLPNGGHLSLRYKP
ncbi:IS66 family insertion sequence hypothetical protein [bacterium DOLZORAL124_64_63]|nr:MAG: IS66 family insertion sequence hypothetical protein [bacterium DOLZORAL124_64_63]PID81770.1 MAG: IS66 family insertion sequence hypothetical protein [bacterium DOLZORAL124_64_63]